MRRGRDLGSGNALPPTLALRASAFNPSSQVSTGNADGFESAGALSVGRSGTVAGGARVFIGCNVPSTSIGGTNRGIGDDARDGTAAFAEHDKRRLDRSSGRRLRRPRGAGRQQHRREAHRRK